MDSVIYELKNQKQVLGFMNEIAKCVCAHVCEMSHLYCQAESLCYPSYHIMTDLVHITYTYVRCISTGMIILCKIYNTNSLKLFFLQAYTFVYLSGYLL